METSFMGGGRATRCDGAKPRRANLAPATPTACDKR
jgi:hypothetical protein